ncbi:minor capsid protein [Actinophytocola sediminis]
MTVTEEFARLLAELGLGTYDDAGTTGDIFLKRLPPEPAAALAVSRYGAGESDAGLPYDTVNVQVRIRGTNTDARDAESRAQAVYDALHGLGSRDLPGGTWLVLCVGLQGGPIDMGADELGHGEYSVNVRAELERVTANRGG